MKSLQSLRRQLLQSASVAALGFGAWQAPGAQVQTGRVLPAQAVPDIALTLHDGRKMPLVQVLSGKTTAVQLMQVACASDCRQLGEVFSRTQERLAGQAGFQLLSISIDPLEDGPLAMSQWLRRQGAGAAWLGATPRLGQVHELTRFLGAGSVTKDRHGPRTYVFDPLSRLAFRTGDFPEPDEVTRRLMMISSMSHRVV